MVGEAFCGVASLGRLIRYIWDDIIWLGNVRRFGFWAYSRRRARPHVDLYIDSEFHYYQMLNTYRCQLDMPLLPWTAIIKGELLQLKLLVFASPVTRYLSRRGNDAYQFGRLPTFQTESR